MKALIPSLALMALLAGCATTGSEPVQHPGTAHGQHPLYSDPTYPGPGVHFGLGVGSWGGRRGAGVGFGLGF